MWFTLTVTAYKFQLGKDGISASPVDDRGGKGAHEVAVMH